MKTRFAFLVLKVVYMMLKGFEQSKIEHSESFKTGINSRQAKETETQKLRKRNVWEKIFAVFDGGADGEIGNDEGDGDGKLTHKELHDLLKRITGGKSKFTEADITGIINRLDENGDGDIDFEEFFKYVTEITDNSDETPEEISNGIFDLVDQPEEGGTPAKQTIQLKTLQDLVLVSGQTSPQSLCSSVDQVAILSDRQLARDVYDDGARDPTA